MTSLLLPLVFSSLTVFASVVPAEGEPSPRDQAIHFLNSWSPSEGTLDPLAMVDVIDDFSKLFAIGEIEISDSGRTSEQWAEKLVLHLATIPESPLRDPRVREIVVEFMKVHGEVFRTAYDLATKYQIRKDAFLNPRRLQVANNPTPVDLAVACGLVLATLGGTVGGGLITASLYSTPYGAIAGLGPMGLMMGWRYANYYTRVPQLERQARKATPAFQALLDKQNSFAVSL